MTMHHLTDADPARDIAPDPDEQLLGRILAEPRPVPAARTRRRRRTPLFAIAGAVTILAVVLLAAPSGSGPGTQAPLDLAAQAYARTSAPADRIVHVVARTTTVQTPQDGGEPRIERGSIEEWHRGAEGHRITRVGPELVLDDVVGADGVLRQIRESGTYRITQPADNEDSANVVAERQGGFVAEFRTRYEKGELDDAGDVRFAGRPARRYEVTPRPETVNGRTFTPPGPAISYYVDRETARPLGYASEMPGMRMSVEGGKIYSFRAELVVERIEELAPTAEHLRSLRTHELPQRRDGNGCVRAPITGARSQDSAKVSDCGGTPGAPIP